MTSQLIILGNGFDIHCGLESSYEKFFRYLILDTYTEHCGYPTMRKDCKGFWESVLFEYYKANGKTNYKWCDVESIIKNTLTSIFFGKSEYVLYGLWNKAYGSAKAKREPEDLIIGIKDSKERFLLKYCAGFYKALVQEKIYSDEEALNLLIKHLLQELHNFERRFCKYIKDQIINPQNEKELNNNYIINAINLLARITGFSDKKFKTSEGFINQELKQFEESINPREKVIETRRINVLSKEFSNLKYTHVLSFNYTALFDFLEVDSPCIYSNVHGKLCKGKCKEGCNLSSVIFGIDDKVVQSQTQYSPMRMFSKTYRKMFDTSTPTSILPPNDGSAIAIKFYGHSLSEADHSYFQSIFDYYNLYSNNKVSLVFYYSKGFEQTDEIYRLINSYGKTLSNQEQGKNLMHKLLLENRLKIEEIT